jgi:hypothetical protein
MSNLTMHPFFKNLLLILATWLTLTSCQVSKDAFELGATQANSNGLMSVRATPPSIGYRRLEAYSGLNSAIKGFVQTKGYPDFIIEQRKLGKMAMVCFYPKKNQAYMIQALLNLPEETQVLGPEPIGEKDKRLFKAIREVENAALAYGQ